MIQTQKRDLSGGDPSMMNGIALAIEFNARSEPQSSSPIAPAPWR